MSKQKAKQLTILPSNKQTDIDEKKTLLELLREKGINMAAPCGGKGRCGKCTVQILRGHEGVPISSSEKRLLTTSQIGQGYRLSCQFKAVSDTIVKTPDSPDISELQESLVFDEEPERSSSVIRRPFTLPLPSLQDQAPDVERLVKQLNRNNVTIDRLHLLRKLPSLLRNNNFTAEAILYDDQIIDLRTKSKSEPLYGIAIDLGTSTIAAYLVNLETGKVSSTRSISNPQSSYGQDIISRIDHTINNPEGLNELRRVLQKSLHGLIDSLCEETSVSKDNIYEVIIAGNSTMTHLFLGITPRYIASSPYVPVTTQQLTFCSHELNMEQWIPQAKVHVLPGISAFVGSDIVAGILCSKLYEEKQTSLLIDLGTNGEIVLKTGEGLFACSAAAGPALEGGHIQHGMIAAPGAIDRVWIDEGKRVSFSTINNNEPAGICGSGLIDAIAAMLDIRLIDTDGRLTQDPFFFDSAHRTVKLTQRDVREVQLAKSAIRTGIELLYDTGGISPEDTDRVFLAGAFGNNINPQSAIRIGLLPDILQQRVTPIGNAAGTGACMCLLNSKNKEKTRMIASEVEYVELSAKKEFADHFMHFMTFPQEVGS
jgi:uncharacterized 2Fe-2S/4Fe-4S cluster protein (DUF4445 family)